MLVTKLLHLVLQQMDLFVEVLLQSILAAVLVGFGLLLLQLGREGRRSRRDARQLLVVFLLGLDDLRTLAMELRFGTPGSPCA